MRNIIHRIWSSFRINNKTVTFSLYPLSNILQDTFLSIEIIFKLRNQADINISGSSCSIHSQKTRIPSRNLNQNNRVIIRWTNSITLIKKSLSLLGSWLKSKTIIKICDIFIYGLKTYTNGNIQLSLFYLSVYVICTWYCVITTYHV